MTTAHIDLTAIGDDESRRRSHQRGARALIVLAGLILMAFAGRDPEPVLRLNVRLNGGATDFGSRMVGTRSSTLVALRNAARTPFVVAGIVAEGASIQDFSIDVTPCDRILPGALCTATVSFSPHVTGLQSAKFRIVDASNDRSETIVIRGAGISPSTPVSVPPQKPIAPAAKPVTQQVTAVNVTPQPAPISEPVPVTPSPSRPTQPESPVTDIVVPMPREKTPSATPTQPVPTPVVATETTATEPPAIVDTKPPDGPVETTTREPSRTSERFKRFASVAIPLIAGAVIANQNRGHGDHNADHNADRRIDVSPRSLMLRSNPNVPASRSFPATTNNDVTNQEIVTVTNIGRDSVTIGSIEFAGGSAGVFRKQTDCEKRTLAPKGQCRIRVAVVESGRGARSTLVVNSDGGRATVALATQPYTTGKP